MKVILFSTNSCSWCRRAKKYFRENKVPFKEIKVSEKTSHRKFSFQ